MLPVALGWLRVSHRELDKDKSTPYQPYHKHEREIKLKPGEIVPVEIEIWPSSTLFERGEKLRVVVQGSDIYFYPEEMHTNAHTATVNKEFAGGFGGKYAVSLPMVVGVQAASKGTDGVSSDLVEGRICFSRTILTGSKGLFGTGTT